MIHYKRKIIKFLLRCNTQYPDYVLLEKLKAKMNVDSIGYDSFSEEKLKKALEKIIFDYCADSSNLIDFDKDDRSRYHWLSPKDFDKKYKRTSKYQLISEEDKNQAIGLLRKFGPDPVRAILLLTCRFEAGRLIGQIYAEERPKPKIIGIK